MYYGTPWCATEKSTGMFGGVIFFAGMRAYAMLRITGSFAGPMFLTIPFPLLLAVLAAVALLAVIPLSRDPGAGS